MKICPYALSGVMSTFDYYHREYYRVLYKVENMTETEYERHGIYNDEDGVIKSIVCRGKNCGRYALCNPQSATEQPQENKKLAALFNERLSMFKVSELPTRAKNIIQRVLYIHGREFAEKMKEKDWLMQKYCGKLTAKEIMQYLHGD